MVHRIKSFKKQIEEGELWDIFEDLNDDNIAGNIQEIMHRKRLWKRGMKIVLPVGGLNEQTKDSYQADFEVFFRNDIVLKGTAYGWVWLGEIIDMTAEFYR